MLAIAADGSKGKIVLRTGSGPGEVKFPDRLAPTPEGGVAVFDYGRAGALLFGPDGAFVRLIRFPFQADNIKGFAVLDDGDLLVSGGVTGRPTAIHRFDANGKLVAEWFHVPKTEDPRTGVYIAGGALSAASGHTFLFSQAAPHLILRYHPDGRADTLAADPSILDPIGDDFIISNGPRWIRYRWNFPQSRGVFELADHRILNVITIREEHRSIWQVYSPAGKLLAQTTLPRGYVVWNLARNGDLLASYQDPDTDEDVVARLRMRVR